MKYGRNPPHDPATHPRLRLGPALRPDQITVPDTVDYLSAVPDWPMYLNDRIGDCTVAAAGHMLEAWTQYGRGTAVKVSDADVLKAYSAVSGYNPATGANDDGAVMQDVLDYWRKTGIGSHRILAFAEVDVAKPSEVAAALYLFGHVYVGLNVPASAEDQFARGTAWDVVSQDGGILGGHAVDLGYRDARGQVPWFDLVTWGSRQNMTAAFWDRYVEEAWVVADAEWVSETGGSPPGLDVATLNAQFTALTGKSGPFIVAPPPTPTPSPADPADVAFAAVLRHHDWVHRHHVLDNAKVAAAGRIWLTRKGL